jgi:tryptophanyl-tRNA synthetase
MDKEVILTGLRSNAEFHLGNYLGAILPMVELQKQHAGQYQLNMFIPDLHSFTTPIDHAKLYGQTLQNLRIFVAAGLDIDQPDTYIYRQSFIPAHSEMTWILDCFAYYGELARMTEFKDKSSKQENISAGLFNYPALMAADILLYGAKWVPVGEDQRQHVEFTRDLATRMNNKFGDLFVIPADNVGQMKFSNRSEPVRIRSLRNPEKKMSKSVDDPAGTIMLSDSPEEAARKIMSATTDSDQSIRYDWEKQPGIANLLQVLALVSDRSIDETANQWNGKQNYGELKEAVAGAVSGLLTDLQTKLTQVDEGSLLAKLEGDESKMCEVAKKTLNNVQVAVGLRPKTA